MIIGHRSSSNRRAIIKDLRSLNLLDEFFPSKTNETRVQETVEVLPCPQSCERIFYSYVDDRTDTRRRTLVRFDRTLQFKRNYSSTLFIFPQQRYEKYISEIRYAPEHIVIKYRTNLEIFAQKSPMFFRI